MRLWLLFAAVALAAVLLADAAPKKSSRSKRKSSESRERRLSSSEEEREDAEWRGDPSFFCRHFPDNWRCKSAESKEGQSAESEESSSETVEESSSSSSSESESSETVEESARSSESQSTEETEESESESESTEESSSSSDSSEEIDLDGPPPSRLNTAQIEIIRMMCDASENGCQSQPAETVATRAELFDMRLDVLAYQNVTANQSEIAESAMEKIFQAKQALFASQGLADIATAYDDGLWAGDIFLTETQAQMILDSFAENQESENRRKKRYSYHLENRLAAKWDLPIYYVIEPSFSSPERKIVHDAIADIEAKTCVRFRETSGYPTIPHIFFKKTYNAGFCGLSYLGRIEPPNNIWLNFECKTILGSTIHEILHALGCDHHHVRYDRDAHIRVEWSNVNPQQMDLFRGNSKEFTSYGIPYDYHSVMHYGPKAAARDWSRPTMVPVRERSFFQHVIGQRQGLSDRDAALVRKMYCLPDCADEDVFCGWWATSGYCERHFRMMLDRCPKSCDWCPMKVNEEAKRLEQQQRETGRTRGDGRGRGGNRRQGGN